MRSERKRMQNAVPNPVKMLGYWRPYRARYLKCCNIFFHPNFVCEVFPLIVIKSKGSYEEEK